MSSRMGTQGAHLPARVYRTVFRESGRAGGDASWDKRQREKARGKTKASFVCTSAAEWALKEPICQLGAEDCD